MRVPLFSMLVLTGLLAAGCGSSEPKRTAGTGNLPPERLAIVHVKPHEVLPAWKGMPIHVEDFYVGEAPYRVIEDTSFYILPGKQTFTVDYGPCQHGWGRVEATFSTAGTVYEGPFGRFDATLEPGKQYVIVGTDQLVGKNAVQTEHRLEVFVPPPESK